MRVPKEVLLPLVREINSQPCPFCGKHHKVVISSNPVAYLEPVGESCTEWDTLVHSRAKNVLESFLNGNLPK